MNKLLALGFAIAIPAVQADEPLLITATRTPQTIDDTLASTSLITHEQIVNAPSRDIGDILRVYGGLDVVRLGGAGQQTSVFIRGANSSHTLVMINGIRVNEGSSGLANLQYLLDPQDVDHIEIVRGPRSSLYGSEAIGGVINIITRSVSKSQTDLLISGGQEGSLNYSVRQDLRKGDLGGYISYGRDYTSGYPVLNDSTLNRGNDAHHFATEAAWQTGDFKITGHYDDKSGKNEYLNTFSQSPLSQDFFNNHGFLTIDSQLTQTWQSLLNVSRSTDHLDQIQSRDFAHTEQNQTDWQNNVTLSAGHLLTIGSTYSDRHITAQSFGSYFNNTLNNWAGYAQDQWHWEDLTTQLAGRYESSDQYGHHDTGEITLGYALSADQRVYATHSTGFKAPTANDLYGYGGNPQLRPESASNYEVGFKSTGDNWQLELAAYRNEVSDLINFALIDPVSFQYQAQNIDHALMRGAEATFNLKDDSLESRTQYHVVRAIDLTTDRDLARRPRFTLSEALTYRQSAWAIGIEVIAASRSFNSAMDDITLPGYSVANLTAQWQAKPWLRVFANMDNITDRHYGLAASSATEYYRAQPRLAIAGIEAKF